MKTKSFDCPKCGAKKTVLMTQTLTDNGVVTNIRKCSECEEILDVDDVIPIFREVNKEQSYYLD